jgi:putative PEP-CTERM system integral membrane protein
MYTSNQTSPELDKTVTTRLQWVQYGLFWSWNLVFLAFMVFGFIPVLLPNIVDAVRTGTIPLAFLFYALVLALIPLACVILGLTVLRGAPSRLFALGYVVEGPLMLILIIRFFLIRQATAGLLYPMAIVLLGMAAFLLTQLDKKSGNRRPSLEVIRLAGLTLMALAGLYAAVWLAFYAVPLGVEGLRGLGNLLSNLPQVLSNIGSGLRDTFIYSPLMVPLNVLGVILLLFTGTLLVLTPIAVPVLALRYWQRSLSGLVHRLGLLRPAVLVCVVIAASAGIFKLANRQPQGQVFDLLAKPPATQAEARALLDRSVTIRDGLLNAYLAPFRYISSQGGVTHISNIYEATFKMSAQQAFAIQRLYEGLASPLLYQPVHPPLNANSQDPLVKEPQEAASLYQRFFDETITQGERQTIVQAVRSTWSSDQAEAAWQAVDDREVLLTRQEVTLQEHGDWADIELHEVYKNQTADLQEVVYYFNLPESAVVTGLWLGNSSDKAQAFKFQVAPRGAAQAVYREETRVYRDPALVEQIGPRQYRLRVYPVPGIKMTYDPKIARSIVGEAPELHMWLAWREMAEPAGWPMPHMALKRNVYWDNTTTRLVNGKKVNTAEALWMSESIPAAGSTTPSAHRIDLPGDQTVLALPGNQVSLPKLAASTRLAVVLDRSRSMQAYVDQVIQSLARLKDFSASGTPVDVYLTSSPYRGEEPSLISLNSLDAANILYFGGQNAAELIAQFEALRGARKYDAVLVLTDGSGYELGKSTVNIAVPDTPIWLVHVAGAVSLGYDDQTLEAIQASGGGVTDDVETALERLAVAKQPSSNNGSVVSDLLDGYLWVSLPTQQAESQLTPGTTFQKHSLEDGFAALAVRRLVLAEMQRNRGTIDQLGTLDYLHSLATSVGIVTPYSSMIVLVEADQQQLLDKLSGLEDRYQREVESLGDTTPAIATPLAFAGVPEPQEWLLMGLAAAMLAYAVLVRRR